MKVLLCVTLRVAKGHHGFFFFFFSFSLLIPLLLLLLSEMAIGSVSSSLFLANQINSNIWPLHHDCITPSSSSSSPPVALHTQRPKSLFFNGDQSVTMQNSLHLQFRRRGKNTRSRKNGALVLASSSSSAAMGDSSSSSVSDVVWPASGAFIAMAAMSYLDKLIEPIGLTFTIAPFGAVCVVLFAAPNSPAAKKYNMFVAHIGCAALGVAAVALFGPGWLARATSLSASLAFMHLTGSFHPPAAGLPLLFIDVPKFQKLQWWYIIFPSAVGCALLCLLQEAVAYLKKTYIF